MELHATIALKFDYLHVEFHTTGRPSLSALVDKLLLLTHSEMQKKKKNKPNSITYNMTPAAYKPVWGKLVSFHHKYKH